MALAGVFALTLTYLTVEVIGGVVAGSLVLLAAAAHTAMTLAGLGFALFVMRVAGGRTSAMEAHGNRRAEILVPLSTAIVAAVILAFVVAEAYARLRGPPIVESSTMFVVAAMVLVAKVAALAILSRIAADDVKSRAYDGALSGAVISVGTILTAAVMIWMLWYGIDAIVAVGIVLLTVWHSARVLRQSVDVALEGRPVRVNCSAIREVLATTPGVIDVHDLRVWSLRPGVNAMSAHIVIPAFDDPADILIALRDRARRDLRIVDATFQLEPSSSMRHEAHF